MSRGPRVRAPQLTGRRWLNTDGEVSLTDLRGTVVLLDFWTGCCVNCLHVLDELRPLEAAFPGVLVVIGVHSPKFPHEAEPAAVEAAVERHGVHHPVLDDPDLTTWQAYAARAWPTLVVVDPEGYVVASLSGEGHADELHDLVAELVTEHAAKGTLRRDGAAHTPAPAVDSALRFPARALRLPDGDVLVADTAHHQLVRIEPDLETERRRFGTGERGLTDGDEPTFAEPQGLVLLPAEVAAQVGYDVVVADSANHALRGVRLGDGAVRTVAGTGNPLRRREGGGPARQQDLSTPWDVAWFDGQVVVAMAGVHQLWAFDPVTDVVRVLAGTTAEGIHDGPAEAAWFAQPSGLAVSPDGAVLWIADAETSALRSLRRVPGPHTRGRTPERTPDRTVPEVGDDRMANVAPIARPGYEVTTHVGQGLFEFGFRDGPAAQALLQHPLGLTLDSDGSVLVADTYNGAVRRFDPGTGELSTVLRGLAEPSDVLVDPDGEGEGVTLTVVESSAHRLTRAPRVPRRVPWPLTDLADGAVELVVGFTPPPGQAPDDRGGEPARLVVEARPPELLTQGCGAAQGLTRSLRFAGGATAGAPAGVLLVTAQTATCDGDPGTAAVPEHAACHLHRQVWEIPVRLVAGGPAELLLDLSSCGWPGSTG